MAIFKGKHFFWSLFLIKLQPWRKKLQYRYLPKNIASFLRTAFFKEHVWWKTRLAIFPMSRNYTFETSYFTDLRFWQRGCDALFHNDHMEKIITKQTISNDFVFNSFSSFWLEKTQRGNSWEKKLPRNFYLSGQSL